MAAPEPPRPPRRGGAGAVTTLTEALRAIGQHSPGTCQHSTLGGGSNALACFQWARALAEEALGVEVVWAGGCACLAASRRKRARAVTAGRGREP